MFENEEWRGIEDFPQYLVSQYGRIKHVDRLNARKVTVNEKGFPIVVLFGKTGKTRFLRQVNKLVADAFLPPPEYDDQNAVWHIDGDLTNCRADNLKWELRSRVLEWNEMHRTGRPRYKTPQVKNNTTGVVYADAFECAMEEGELESRILWRIEQQARSLTDDNARYRYILRHDE